MLNSAELKIYHANYDDDDDDNDDCIKLVSIVHQLRSSILVIVHQDSKNELGLPS